MRGTTREATFGAIGVVVLLAAVGAAFGVAGSQTDTPDLTREEAKQIATDHVDGTALSVEFEREEGPVYEVTVEQTDGRLTEVEIDGDSGEVLEVETEDDEREESENETEGGDDDS